MVASATRNEITSFERPHCFAFVARSRPRDFNQVFTFSEEGGGMVERTMTFEPVPALAERPQAISKLLDERRDTSMSMLKELIESRAGTGRSG